MPASRSFLDASIPDLVKKLRVDEKVSLLAGPNWWNTSAVERLEIPAIRMSDGPNVMTLDLSAYLLLNMAPGSPWLVPFPGYSCAMSTCTSYTSTCAHIYSFPLVRDCSRSDL